MLTRKKFVILAAVILALIMVVPTSYIISADLIGHKPLPAISTNDSYASQSWAFNFDANDYNIANLSNESASFRQPGYSSSFLNLSMELLEIPYGGIPYANERPPQFYFGFMVTGSVMASTLPTGVMVSYNSSLPSYFASDQPFFIISNEGYFETINATEMNVSGFQAWGGASHIIQLVNQSNYNGKNPYRFVFNDGIGAAFYSIEPNQPFIFNFNFTLLGLSKPVYNDMLIQLMDVNSTAGSTGFVVTDSHPYDSTQNSDALINFQSPHMKVAYCKNLLRSSSSPLSTADLVTGSIIQDSISASTRSYDVLLPQIQDAESESS